jgi:N-acetylglutamate synthase-like GNAT family acetyltransferase
MHLPPQSRRYRFLDTLAAPSEQLLNRLTNLDASSEAAFVALITETGVQREIGVARMSALGDGRAEFAVTVRDDWQHKGLATLLTRRVIEAARCRGVQALFSVDSSDNLAMQEFARSLGFERTANPDDVTEVIHTLKLN